MTPEVARALGIVPKHYLMNPSTERMISGTELEDGMIILTGNDSLRADTSEIDVHEPNQTVMAKANRWNRWMRISKLQPSESGSSMSFVATYHDGSQMFFNSLSAQNPWFVKLSDEGWEWTQS